MLNTSLWLSEGNGGQGESMHWTVSSATCEMEVHNPVINGSAQRAENSWPFPKADGQEVSWYNLRVNKPLEHFTCFRKQQG